VWKAGRGADLRADPGQRRPQRVHRRWHEEIRSICDEFGIMLIIDEVQTA